jgi:hypothetical protein
MANTNENVGRPASYYVPVNSPSVVVMAVMVAIAMFSSVKSASAQCSFDYWGGRTSSIQVTAGNKILIVTTTSLNHTTTHPSCDGSVAAKAEMVGPANAGGCATARSTGTHTYAQARKDCPELVAGSYWTHGYHYWQTTEVSQSDSNQITISGTEDACEGGCDPGYTPSCQGDQTPDECGCCVDYTPILIDLTGEGVFLSGSKNGVAFQINDTGSKVRVAWPSSPNTAWLVLDRNNDGLINDGSELFGNTTRLFEGDIARNGYEALAEFDQNGDGVIDHDDSVFRDLRLWVDLNRDGISQPEELIKLRTAGVVSMSLDAKESRRTDQFGNRFRYRAKVQFVDAPHQRFSFDVYPATESLDGTSACLRRQTWSHADGESWQEE